jgi:hypothetical protein
MKAKQRHQLVEFKTYGKSAYCFFHLLKSNVGAIDYLKPQPSRGRIASKITLSPVTREDRPGYQFEPPSGESILSWGLLQDNKLFITKVIGRRPE